MPKKLPPPDRTEELRASFPGGKGRPRELRVNHPPARRRPSPQPPHRPHWLEAHGFTPGARLTVTAEEGKLTLTLATRPRSS